MLHEIWVDTINLPHMQLTDDMYNEWVLYDCDICFKIQILSNWLHVSTDLYTI